MDRRRFLQSALGAGLGAGCGWTLAAPGKEPLPVVIADIAALPEGALRVYSEQHVVVHHQPGKGLAVLSARCTHLGCGLRARGHELICPCHGGRFAADGSVRAGPPPRPLPWLEAELDPAGLLTVHPGRENRQRRLLPLPA